VGRERGIAGFRCREKRLSLTMILTTKIIDFYTKWFHIMRGVQIRCFLGSIYNNRLELGKSFGFRLILGFEVGFCVFEGHGLV